MSTTEAIRELVSALIGLDYQRARGLTRKALGVGASAKDILAAVQGGMTDVGKKYEDGEYFLSELMAAGEIFKAVMEELTPYLASTNPDAIGTVVIGTVQGDLHDIGKNIVKTLLQASGFKIIDLGVDVSPQGFVDEVRKSGADILGLSALLTTTMGQMRIVIDQLEKAGLRGKVRVIVGGNSITKEFGKEIGADAAVREAAFGARLCREWSKR